jgi:hypothetical protein
MPSGQDFRPVPSDGFVDKGSSIRNAAAQRFSCLSADVIPDISGHHPEEEQHLLQQSNTTVV